MRLLQRCGRSSCSVARQAAGIAERGALGYEVRVLALGVALAILAVLVNGKAGFLPIQRTVAAVVAQLMRAWNLEVDNRGVEVLVAGRPIGMEITVECAGIYSLVTVLSMVGAIRQARRWRALAATLILVVWGVLVVARLTCIGVLGTASEGEFQLWHDTIWPLISGVMLGGLYCMCKGWDLSGRIRAAERRAGKAAALTRKRVSAVVGQRVSALTRSALARLRCR